MNTAPLEPFVDAVKAGEFLSLKPRRVVELARSGQVPAYPIGTGARRVWRFRLSELASALQPMTAPASVVYGATDTSYRSKPPRAVAGGR